MHLTSLTSEQVTTATLMVIAKPERQYSFSSLLWQAFCPLVHFQQCLLSLASLTSLDPVLITHRAQ